MPNLTPEQYRDFEAKRVKHSAPPPPASAVERESDLHDEILEYCRQKQWPCVHSRMDAKTTTQLGVPDFIIAMPNGKTLWVEAKSRTGKMKPDQMGFKIMLEMLAHSHCIVRSMDEFLAACDPAKA